jgi:uncharacterized protein YydD (DUF2326 family)
MIHGVSSDLASFKSLDLRPGLNILLADKSAGATDRQSRNGAGKTSLVELIHFALGANADKGSIFRSPTLEEFLFKLDLDVCGARLTAGRRGKKPSLIQIDGDPSSWPVQPTLNDKSGLLEFENEDWKTILGHLWFGLPARRENEDKARFEPSFRSLFSYFARRQSAGGFLDPTRNGEKQQNWDQQVAVSYLLGLDWTVSQGLQELRGQEKMTGELRKAAKGGELGRLFENAADLRTKLAVAEAKAVRLKNQISSFKVVPQYEALEREATDLTRSLNSLSDENVIDRQLVDELRRALEAEADPATHDLTALYEEAGVVLPGVVAKRYADVEAFHRAILANRRSHLSSEIQSADARIVSRIASKVKYDKRRAEIMEILNAGGALDSYNRLNEETGRVEAEVQTLRLRLEAAERLETTKTDVNVRRAQIAQALKNDIHERAEIIREAILTFEGLSEALYEKEGSLTIAASNNGPVFEVKIESQRSKGINNMQIFCFDMMLSVLGKKRNRSPGFLIHDSHLFDGVDERQTARALQLGAQRSREHGFQYLVTLNSDALPKDGFDEGFRVEDHILPIRLTDASETGGLFGLRFD